jgi:predicted AlkP superfamily pyrophosphatase or phosphodiesterase
MKIRSILLLILFVLSFNQAIIPQEIQRPKLVVGIVVDQMRFEYLYKFQKYYSKDGFNRLLNGGTNFSFAHFNYVPTTTAPGHASIYTGTTPAYHGIIANDFYDKQLHKMISSVWDSTRKSIGSSDHEGEISPDRLLSTTITDQLKLATMGASKVIAISLKDRSAVLPGGHMADAAYWYDNQTGNFISSSYYMKNIPAYIDEFNKRKSADKYLSEGWSLSHPANDYSISVPDESKYERDVFHEGKTSFPHKFNHLDNKIKYEAIETTPFGNQIVEELAKSALINENMGIGNVTDFLAISFSSTDHVGHEYGTFSFETEDIYIKLDSLIADFLKVLDKQVGENNYLLFLTADHGALETPGYLKDNNLPVGGLNTKQFSNSLKSFISAKYSDEKLIENVSNSQIYFDRNIIKKKNLEIHQIEQTISDYLRDTFPVIAEIFTRDELENNTPSRESSNLILNGFNPSISGDIAFTLRPGYLANYQEKGTTHSSPYSYDTHVPMIFYGWHIPAQVVNIPVYTIDIAATIADLLKITEPSASIGIPLIK